MKRARTLVLLWAAVFAPGFAAAQDDVPSVDVRDLPPLPELRAADNLTTIAVIAAQRAEEDVVVGAAKREQSLGNVASAVTVIPGDRLRRFGYRTVAEAVRAVAGVYILDDRMVPRIGIRGLQLLGDFNTRILVLVDGATVNEPWNQYTGIAHDLPIAIDDVARIEIVRGPVSSVYGTNAFFGIVNIVTRAADQSPNVYVRAGGGQFGTLSGVAGVAYGNVNRQVRASFGYGVRAGETLDVEQLGGPIDADGMIYRNLAVVGQFDGAFAQVRYLYRDKELTFAPYEGVPGSDDNRETDQLVLVEAGYTRELAKRVTLTARGYFNRYRYDDYIVYDPDPLFRDIGISEWMGAELRGYARVLDKGRLGVTAGLEVTDVHTESQSFETGFEEDGIFIPTDFQVFGVYSEVESTPLPFLSFSAGLRFDSNTKFQDKLSPRAAAFLHKGDQYGLKLLYAEGFRNPSAYEAFFDDGITYTANPDLAPETIRSYEAVLWGRPIGGLNLRLSGFRWEMRDLIEQEEIDVGGGETRLQQQNVSGMTSTGIELEGAYRDTTGWLAFGSITWAEVTRERGDPPMDEPAANAPAIVASAGASTPLLLSLFHVSTEFLFTGSRHTRDETLDAKAFLGWNATIYFPDIAGKGIDLTIGARNIIGTREEIPAQEDFDRPDPPDDAGPIYLLPGEGREFHARIGYRY